MARTNLENTAEILRRADLADKREKQKWERRKMVICSFAFLIAAAALAFSPWSISSRYAPMATAQSALIWGGAGGYVLTGVVCFAVGSAVALICTKWNEIKSKGGTQK